MSVAAAPTRPRYETIIDDYYKANKGKIPDEQIMQNALTKVKLAYGLFSPDWKAAEGPAHMYALKKFSDIKGKPMGQLVAEGMDRGMAALNALMEGKGLSGVEEILNEKKSALNISCAKCKKVMEDHNRCTGCRTVDYCGADCQKADWKAHKKFCKATSAAAKK
jgi:hypothetical protein